MIKNISLIIIFGFLLINLSSLETQAQSLLENGEIPKDLVIRFERLYVCQDLFVDYPDYNLEINANGEVDLKIGQTSRTKARNIKTKIKHEQIKKLINSFEKANFFQL